MNSFSNRLKCVLLCVCVIFDVAIASQSQTVIYWGQQSNGPEKDLREYCMDDTYDIIIVAFVYLFPMASGSLYPGMNFAGHCSKKFDKADKYLLDCSDTIAPDITFCQQQGKKILLSFGGGEGTYGFTSDTQATTFATMVWNMFLGGTMSIRPFGTAVFDGVDLDIEQGDSTGYVAFIAQLRQYFTSASKQYYISAAPQCPSPDFLGPGKGTPFTVSWFDYVWIQFYNNNCGLNAYPQHYNFNTWAAWAATAINPNTKIFIGAPASSDAAGTGYVPLATLQTIAGATQAAYPNVFGGVMLWDCSNSDMNDNFGGGISTYLKSLGTSSPSLPPQPASITTTTTSTSTKHGSTSTTQAASPLTTQGATTHKVHGSTTTSTSTTHAATPLTTQEATTHNGHGSTSTSTSTSTSSSSTTSDSSSCTTPETERCVGTDTYQTCDQTANGPAWTATQSCPTGTACYVHGDHIHCVTF